MKDIITDREDMFWAKMAGRDVDITTMTPPVASNMREKLMLEVAEKIEEGGSGGGGSNLPTPGAAGNVLTSTGSAWQSATPSGGIFVVTIVADTVHDDEKDEDVTTYHAEHDGNPVSIAEIYAAKQAGKIVIFESNMSGNEMQFIPNMITNQTVALATCVPSDEAITEILCMGFVDGHSDEWHVISSDVGIIPVASSTYGGRVVGVTTNGNYAFLDAKIPLVLSGSVIDGSHFEITGTTAKEISDAWNTNREVIIPISGSPIKMKIIECDYNNDSSYRFKFAAFTISASTGDMTVYLCDFENSLTGNMTTPEYTSVTS